MTTTEYKKKLETYQGLCRCPENFFEVWQQRMRQPVRQVQVETVPFANRAAKYETVTLTTERGTIRARCIRPSGDGCHPLMLMFHDLNRGIRGWHHMTRFIAQGYAVLAPEIPVKTDDWKTAPEQLRLGDAIQDALLCTHYAHSLSFVDKERVVTWGEGLGGGLAIAAAAMLPGTVKCCALNPLPGDIRGTCGEAAQDQDDWDIANFAPFVKGEVRMGICLMDEVAPPEGQYAIYNRLTCAKRKKVYPKYAHERVNFFENECLRFLHD